MRQILIRALVAIALCSLGSAAIYYLLRSTAMTVVLSAPLFGVALSRVIIDFVAELRHGARDLSMAHLDGQHFSYLSVTLQVLEDEAHCRWVPTAEVRRIVGSAATDRALALTYPGGWRAMGQPEQAYLRDDALMIYLAKEPSMPAIKFKNWAERNIAFPARRQRERLGIRLDAPTVKEGD